MLQLFTLKKERIKKRKRKRKKDEQNLSFFRNNLHQKQIK